MSESCTLSFLISVAGTPTGVTVSRTAATNVRVSWTAPSTGPTLGGYEVFYQTDWAAQELPLVQMLLQRWSMSVNTSPVSVSSVVVVSVVLEPLLPAAVW